ncbi:SDR family oxidoreductase [Mycobacterium paragordonae]|uniref:SDR family oxidoreductase n=1 Tax=Mycobacterium paragordonae TaxID=1389713 RepID=A0A4R5WNS5_9MYCO|nr:SDR family oxidoreductase [Mycobacterium paragordonae]MDP7736433.1 SDR family oxidoreductase [Mycobacterium paragordonae]TDK92755.1 SDR family oxidoreductase [Mycobacterium paragordonae]TDL04815.1 SDR family oxidoreductase [Mycobacterium paragordonae]
MTKLRGRRVAITGGAQGIGRAIGEALIAAGAAVVLGDVQEAAVRQTGTEIGAKGYHLDVTDPASFEAFLDQAAADLGGLDVLVNNAGIMPIGPFLQESPNVTRRTIEIDVLGVLTGTRLAGTRFAEQGSGHIVNIASVMGTLASPNAATYCASKYAVVGFSEALRQEWRGNGVKVSAICPGFVRTELIAGMSAPGLLERFLVVDPEDVATAVVAELVKGASRTMFVPKLVGLVSRGTVTLPDALVDAAFRLSGGNKVTAELDREQRAAYQARIENQE